MTKYSTTQLINSIESLMSSEAHDHDLLTEVQAAIQKRQKEIIWALGVNVFEPQTAETKAIRNTIAQYLLGAHKEEANTLDIDTETQAALKRVEELKRRYTPEQIVEMRKLRAEVEEMVSEFEAVDKDKNLSDEAKKRAKLELLSKYNIPKYRGKRIDGDPVEFVVRSDTYGRFIRSDVIFKADLRKIDKELVALINQEVHHQHTKDPLLSRIHYTEMVASGVFSDSNKTMTAIAMVAKRSCYKSYQQSRRLKL